MLISWTLGLHLWLPTRHLHFDVPLRLKLHVQVLVSQQELLYNFFSPTKATF